MNELEQDTRDLVFRALDHARANGYDFEDWPAERVAVDLLDYEANLEGREPADVYPHVAAWLRAYGRAWEDRHEVRVPEPCSLDRAFDGEREPQRRELRALERDVLCRLLGDVLHRVRETRDLDSLVWADHRSGVGTGGVRLDAWEVPLLLNLVEVLQPRSEGNW